MLSFLLIHIHELGFQVIPFSYGCDYSAHILHYVFDDKTHIHSSRKLLVEITVYLCENMINLNRETYQNEYKSTRD